MSEILRCDICQEYLDTETQHVFIYEDVGRTFCLFHAAEYLLEARWPSPIRREIPGEVPA